MTKHENAVVAEWIAEATRQERKLSVFVTWLKDNHPDILSEFHDHLLLKALQGE